MIPEPALEEARKILGPQYLAEDKEKLLEYASDATKLEAVPEAVAFPGSSEEISRILSLANRHLFPVIPRGAGSGKSGGALPVRGGLVLAMDRFNRVLDIDGENLVAEVEPGVITSHFQEEVEKLGLFYPPDPASIRISTIGGNVAECAGGMRAVKYGVTRDYVLGLKVVLPTGEIIKTGVRTAKGVVGYDLTRLITGSEGTLAVITSILLRLIPKPLSKKTMVIFFRDLALAVKIVSHILANRIVPSAMEFMDRHSIECVRGEIDLPMPPQTGALLLVEVDGEPAQVEREAESLGAICMDRGAIGVESGGNDEDSERLWDVRRYVSESIFKLRPDKVSEDIVVPRSRMAELVSFLGSLEKKHHLPIPAFGHAGDGNIHVNIMFDGQKPQEAGAVDKVVKELFRKVLDMGGTISGEHGIGVTKASYIGMELPPAAIDLMVRLKKAFDPNEILNPGKIFPGSVTWRKGLSKRV
ncbi:MAG: FAD-binding protein [Deltaproteobacteria bacterium]|nr:FAD-binding protein [Deltaproteobacteria bacterium]MBW2136484.1 FAD-binding protein [Deltaproteobacteria bacterium]